MKISVLKGFTLVELLIAISISSVIFLSLYSAFHTGVLGFNKIDSAFEAYQTARIIFSRIESDLKASFSYPDKSSPNNSRFKGAKDSLEFFSIVNTFKEAEIFPYFSKIKYEFINGELKRSLYGGAQARKAEPEAVIEKLSSNVKAISFQYASETLGVEESYEWLDSWPQAANSVQLKSLPLAVKINLSLAEKDRKDNEIGTVEFNKTVPLPLGGITNALSSSPAGGKGG